MAGSSSGAPLALTVPRIDHVPSLALAIRYRNVDAVATLLEQGAPLDVTAWGCNTAVEMAEHMVEYENASRAAMEVRKSQGKDPVPARRIAQMLEDEVQRRAEEAVPCTWQEPLPEAFDALQVREVESISAAACDPVARRGFEREDNRWQRACTCASRRMLPNVEAVGRWDLRMGDGKRSAHSAVSLQRLP